MIPITHHEASPTADEVDLRAMAADPYPTYERLRALGPVVWVAALGRYLAVSTAACRAIEADQETYSAEVGGPAATMPRALGGVPMLRRDDPEHTRQRQPINSTLRPRSVREVWAPVFESNARRQLEHLVAVGPRTADLRHDFASPLAAQNLIDLLGMGGVGIAEMDRWSTDLIAGIGNLADDAEIWRRCDRAGSEIDAVLDELLPAVRRDPNDSIVSALAASALDDAAVRANVKLTISGGMNEPHHMITSLVHALSRHSEQLAAVRADSTLWPAAFDETVRFHSPVGMYPRQTTRATVLEGVSLPADAPIGVVIAAANRDPATFDRPDVFDITRPRTPHLGFGSGVHQCAGHWAARIAIGEIAVPMLYAELPHLRTDDQRPAAWSGWVFRGLTTLPVTWDRA